MREPTANTLHALLAALHAERIATYKPADLQVNIDQRRLLVGQAANRRFVQAGDHVPAFSLEEVDGATLISGDMLSAGPVVLVFFRFAGCPACNIALPYYQRHLAPGLAAAGATLVAVSPQVPDRLRDIKQRHRLDFSVATDRDNALARHFGILYSFDEASRRQAEAKGRPIGDVTGTGTWELPMPAIIVIGQDSIVRFAEVSPDWLVRTEAEPVLDVVRALIRARAA